MKLAVVGSHIVPSTMFERGARDYIKMQCGLWQPHTIVSGGAPGVDTYAKNFADLNGLVYEPCLPKSRSWLGKDGMPGFMDRNMKIARAADVLLAIHYEMAGSQGGVWTYNYMWKRLHKRAKLVVINRAGNVVKVELHNFPDNDNTLTGEFRNAGSSKSLPRPTRA